MNINWKVRFKNPLFIAALAVIVLAVVCCIVGITIDQINQVFSVASVIVVGVASIIALIQDPTTPGVNDSELSMSKHEPTATAISDVKVGGTDD